MALDLDYNAARNAGFSDLDILRGLQQKGELAFDLDKALADKHDPSDILSSILPRKVEEPAQEPSSLLRRAGDVGISALKGAISIPETAIGLADIVSGGAAGRGAEAIGIRTKDAKEALNELYSPEQKAANQRVANAQGFIDTAGAMLSNPSTLLQTGVESIPSMLAGGAIGRGVATLAPRIGTLGAAAVGEGAVGAGQAAEQIRQQSGGDLSLGQSGAALASGIGTGAFGLVGGRIAQKLGIADIDTALVQAGAPVGSSRGVARRLIEGGVSEGVFEELPQSIQEQIWQNAAMDKPLLEGVPENAAQGLLAGGLFGGIAGAALPARAPSATPEQPGEPLLLGNTPDPFISFPDGSVGRQSDAEAFIAALPEDERLAARARLFGYEAQPVTPDDVLRAQTVDDAIAMAARAVEEGTPEFQAQRNADIDAAWGQYLGERASAWQQQFDAAEQARREADAPLIQEQAADQRVAQAEAITAAQGFDEPQPTAMQLAMQQALQRVNIQAQQQEGADGQPGVAGYTGEIAAGVDVGNLAAPEVGAGAIGGADIVGNPPASGAGLAPDVQRGIPAIASTTGQAAPNAGVAATPTATLPEPAGVQAVQPAAAPAAVTPETFERARAILNAAGVTGNDRLVALRSIRNGENTLEDLADAHPPTQGQIDEPTRPDVRNDSVASDQVIAPPQPSAAPGGEVVAEPDSGGAPDAAAPAPPSGASLVDAATQAATPPLDNDISDIPVSFAQEHQVPHRVWVEDERVYEEVEIPATEALDSVREDINNLKALLRCMRG